MTLLTSPRAVFYFLLSTFFRIGTGGEVGDWSDPAQFLVH
jgi:hypothetical protein